MIRSTGLRPVASSSAMYALTASVLLAASDGDTKAAGGGILQFAFLPLMLLAGYFLIIRPNSRKRKEALALQSALEVGDEVITTSGIIGKITGEDGPTRFWLEIDDDVQVRIARGFIQGRIAAESAADESDAAKSEPDALTESSESTGPTGSTDRD
jgi:preprotein translocase subunit YajC